MDEKRKRAYRYIQYFAFLEIRQIHWLFYKHEIFLRVFRWGTRIRQIKRVAASVGQGESGTIKGWIASNGNLVTTNLH
jgi:hypothetical protein